MKKVSSRFDTPKNGNRLLNIFYLFLGVLLVVDFFIDKHADFPWEGAVNFYAVYGFISFVALVFIAKLLRRVIQRKEDYYDN
ncbi:MAG: hypothetical protein RBT11_02200 [Desulfobacterales bacterium]|jgi:hypothetical protein|nr:hypothetical protein [Desulfobacterales bacterium]